MIKIEHPDLDRISKKYFQDIKKAIQDKCFFIIEVLDVLFNGKPSSELENHSLNGNTKKAVANLFLKNDRDSQLKNQNEYHKVRSGNMGPWVAGSETKIRSIATILNDHSNLEKLILCCPDIALSAEIEIRNKIRPSSDLSKEEKSIVNYIIDYSLFDKKYSYNIAAELNINTCPYCNRNYINTVIDDDTEGLIRPTFDHFYSQKDHPFLALSFFNLIPSCYYCNSSLKGDTQTNIDTHIHPYKEGFGKDATFHILTKRLLPDKSSPNNYKLFLKDNMLQGLVTDRYQKIFGGTRTQPNLCQGNNNLFKLDIIYQSHLDIVGELVVKCDKLSEKYASSLQPLFRSLGTGKEEFYRYYFGNFLNEKDFNRRPMAKLTKDVVSQILESKGIKDFA